MQGTEIADALHQVVDDEAAHEHEATAWAAGELIDGRDFPGVVADLVIQGWSPEDAEAAVERARIGTRAARGVVTREDIAGDVARRHGSINNGLSAFFRSGIGLFSVFSFFAGFRSAVHGVRHLGRLSRPKPER